MHDCRFYAYLPIVNGPALPRGNVVYNTTSYCTEEDFVQGFAWAKNTSDVYYVDVEVQFSGWGIASARLLPGEEHTFQIEPGLTSIPAGIAYITLQWENGETQSFEVPFEALDCTPADWAVVHVERDPWVWSGTYSWDTVPTVLEPPREELRLISLPIGRQIVLQAHGHTVEYLVVEWYDQEYILTVFIDGIEVETNTGEIAEVVFQDANGVDVLAVFVGEGCGTNECQNVTTWWRSDPTTTGLLVVDIANEW